MTQMAAAQTVLTLQPNGTAGKDAEIFSCGPCGYNTRNFGNIAENCAIAWTKSGSSHNIRSLIQFDLSSIPVTAAIQNATLSLFWAPGSDEGKHYGFFGSNSAWLERITANWTESTVTWNTQPTTSTLHRVALAGSSSATQNYTNINVTQLLKDMVANPSVSFGFMLKLQNESPFKKLVFASSDHGTAAIRPMLVVTYTSHTPLQDEALEMQRAQPEDAQLLNIYPNPAKNKFHVTINSSSVDMAWISVYDLNGKEMLDRSCQLTEGRNQFAVETAGWTRGLYMVLVKTGGEMITERLLLE